jgi:hypothetical protein
MSPAGRQPRAPAGVKPAGTAGCHDRTSVPIPRPPEDQQYRRPGLAHIAIFGIRAVRVQLTGAMIAKDFPFVEDLHRISCECFVIMKGGPAGAGAEHKNAGYV